MTGETTGTEGADRQANIAMILGLSSLCCSCFTGLPAIVLGIIAYPKASPSGKTRAAIGIGGATLLVAAQMGVGAFNAANERAGGPRGGPAIAPDAPEAAAPAGVPMPEQEAAFCSIIAESGRAYQAGDNDLKKSKVRGDRARALAQVLGNGIAEHWVGTVATLTTNGDGKAVFGIKLPCGASVGTWNNSLSDIGSNTLISQSSAMFTTLSELEVGEWGKPGSKVRFDGMFISGSGPDGYGEKSLTEVGSMTDPDFVFRFGSVQAY